MTNRQDFLDFLSPQILFLTAAVFVFFTLSLVALIYYKMYRKKQYFFGKQKINEQLNIWISEILMEEEAIVVTVPEWLENYFSKQDYRHYIADSLITIRKNLSGAASQNIAALYEQLGLKEDALAKLKSVHWHKKARGIYELYIMGQKDAMPEITRYTNSRHEVVRMEAQIAAVGFYGFKGLAFLSNLSYPLTEWQQLQLLEQLEKLDIEEMPALAYWLNSSNAYVQMFALRLADIYNQYQVHALVENSLNSEKETIRAQAIKTLGNIAKENTSEILINCYRQETNANKINILKQLCSIATDNDLQFLLAQLEDKDDNIKLTAARAIVSLGDNGWEVLAEKINGNDVLLSISRQIKYEMTK